MKKLICVILVLFTLFALFPCIALGDEFNPESVRTPYICLMDAQSGAVLYEKSARTQAYPASTTKIMTCILALELASDLNNEIVNTGSNPESRGSTCNFSRNEQMPLIDMLYGMMLVSGNDAARAIAEHFGGGEESAFVEKMNAKAAELGMTATHFVKSNGLHKDEHYSSAYDMALLTRYAMKNETFRKIVATTTYDAPATNKDSNGYQWYNSNRLIYKKENEADYRYPYAIGVKTGDTDQAGRCLVAAAKKDGVELILVLFGDPQGDAGRNIRFENSAKLFDWGFENFVSVDVSALGLDNTMQLPVSNASFEDAEGGLLTVNIDFTGAKLTGLKSTVEAITADISKLTTSYVTDRKLEAPITAGEELGVITYMFNGEAVFSAKLTAARDVAQAAKVVESAEPSASTTPLIVGSDERTAKDEKSGGWLFWVLIIAVLLIIALVVQLVANKRRRRRARKRRTAYKNNFRR